MAVLSKTVVSLGEGPGKKIERWPCVPSKTVVSLGEGPGKKIERS